MSIRVNLSMISTSSYWYTQTTYTIYFQSVNSSSYTSFDVIVSNKTNIVMTKLPVKKMMQFLFLDWYMHFRKTNFLFTLNTNNTLWCTITFKWIHEIMFNLFWNLIKNVNSYIRFNRTMFQWSNEAMEWKNGVLSETYSWRNFH